MGAITIRSSKNTGRELREMRNHAGEAAYKIIKKEYNDKVKSLSQKAEDSKKQLSNMFRFSEEVFGEGQEILIIVTDLRLIITVPGLSVNSDVRSILNIIRNSYSMRDRKKSFGFYDGRFV